MASAISRTFNFQPAIFLIVPDFQFGINRACPIAVQYSNYLLLKLMVLSPHIIYGTFPGVSDFSS